MKIVALIFALLISGIGYLAYQDAVAWDAFSKSHHCHIIATQETQALPILGGDNVQFLVIPEKNTYLCDGGYQVTR